MLTLRAPYLEAEMKPRSCLFSQTNNSCLQLIDHAVGVPYQVVHHLAGGAMTADIPHGVPGLLHQVDCFQHALVWVEGVEKSDTLWN